ncbi:MAG: 16S rRNA (cytosine(1402)-N(4))-methyltransferase RsmH [Gammaproteobacteria bacterium]|nr:16S rRNA (cytosine(1402)-N(4))-methyltransferase RsmH [Gammaproteobacteria bacterium]MDD9850868.1 16S rRNA (cytosine(1402)-N(4))-methyltransferase RsmH [Gammaproteobacteria bacterium]
MRPAAHKPVMVNEVLQALHVQKSGAYVDATFGGGGHARAILSRLGAGGMLIAMDRDPQAVDQGRRMPGRDARLHMVCARFSELAVRTAPLLCGRAAAGIVFDLGVSSPQLDDAGRGFSFLRDGPLDMRMNPADAVGAAEWLAAVGEEELCDVLRRLGEERYARRIARRLCESRARRPLRTTGELAALVAAAVPGREPGKHPATRTFRAIRMHINRELEELRAALPQALQLLAAGGRLAVLSFHSLEDRVVKRFMQAARKGDPFPPDLPVPAAQLQPLLKTVGRAQKPQAEEVRANPRARSAVLRVAERTAGGAHA